MRHIGRLPTHAILTACGLISRAAGSIITLSDIARLFADYIDVYRSG